MRSLLWISLLALAATSIPLAAADDADAFLLGKDVSTTYGDPVTFTAQLLDPNSFECGGACPMVNRQVDFYVDGAYIGTDITNSGGYAYFRVADSSAWHVGSHTVRAQFDRFPAGAATVTNTLTVEKEGTGLVARDGYLQARLTTDDGAPLSGLVVRFSYVTPAGEQNACHAYTDADGVASCVPVSGVGVSPTAAASYKATFDGTSDYVASTSNGALI